MATLITLAGKSPQIGRDVYLAPTAVLVGDVTIGDRSSVWFGAVLRGDLSRIEIGAESCIQDNAVVHTGLDVPTRIGNRVVVGHGALVQGCTIDDGAVIGMGAIVLDDARVGASAMIAAGTVVKERQEIRPGTLAAGVPAAEKQELGQSTAQWLEAAAAQYVALRARYLDPSTSVSTV